MWDTITALPSLAGVWFTAACGLEFLAVGTEQAGASRRPLRPRQGGAPGVAAFVLMLASTLAPALLLMQGFFVTAGMENSVRIAAMGAPIAAVILGSVIGRVVGGASQAASDAGRFLALAAGLAALGAAIFAARGSIEALLAMMNGEAVSLPVAPV